MSINNVTTKTLDSRMFGGIVETGRLALDVSMERQGLIQSNIANIETPGYLGQDFSFAAVMNNALRNRGELSRTDSRHVGLDPVSVSENMELSRDKRPVDLDEEMQKLSENQLLFQTVSKIIGNRFDSLKMAIDEGGK